MVGQLLLRASIPRIFLFKVRCTSLTSSVLHSIANWEMGPYYYYLRCGRTLIIII